MSLQQNRLASLLLAVRNAEADHMSSGIVQARRTDWLSNGASPYRVGSVEMQMAKVLVLIKAGTGEQLREGKANLFQELRAICLAGED